MARAKKRKFSYQRRTKEDVDARANQRGGNFDTYIKDDIKLFKPREGKNTIRILPPTWDVEEGERLHYGYNIFVNYNIGPDNQSYLSLSKMKGEPDPLEEAMKEAQKDGDKKTADALKPTKRVCMYVIDRMAEEEGPLLWAAPWTFDRDLSDICRDEDTGEVVLIDDPYGEDEDGGRDLKFVKTGTGRNTQYPAAKMKLMKLSPLSEDEELMEEWLDFVTNNPIPEVLNFYDYDHIEASFGGQIGKRDDDDEDEDDDDDEDEKPRGRRRGSSGKASSKRRRPTRDEDEDEDDEDEETEDEDEDEDEEPRSKRKATKGKTKTASKRRRARDEDEDEDEEAEDEDDEETEDEDDEETEDEDDEEPNKKSSSRRSKVSSKIKETKKRSARRR